MKIYHNNRCRKSREGVQYLMKKGIEFKIIDYMKENISENKMKELLIKLNISAIDLIRKNEKIWKDNYKGGEFTEKQVITLLCKQPKLMERPIIEAEFKAVIGRPKENIDKLNN